MKKILAIAVALLCTYNTYAWSRALHAAVAAIAEDNLTEQAKQNITNALDGKSMVYHAQWLKDVGGTPEYAHTRAWRNVAMTPKGKLIVGKKAQKHAEPSIQKAQAYDALIAAVSAIESGKLNEKELADNIRYIITITADLHCPTHYIFTDMIEKRKSYYYYDGKKHRYDLYWENSAVKGTFSWRTNEFVHQLSRKTPEQVAQITKGSITSWITGNAPLYRDIYMMLDTGTSFDKKGLRNWQNKIYPISTEQIAVAGYRLAAILNGLFDSSVPNVKTK